MAKFCPNCGKSLATENIKFCPECGSSISTNSPSSQAPNNEQPEKIYLKEKGITIGSKMWYFIDGYDTQNPNQARSKIIPVHSISSADIASTPYWWAWIIPGLIILAIGLVLAEDWAYPDECTWGVIGIVGFLVSGITAINLKNKKCVEIHTHNSNAAAYIKVDSMKDANRYITAMTQCLLENK